MTEVFKALSDGTRREILRLLQAGDLSAGEIASHFEISKPSISHHLSILKNAELIFAERNGQEIMYSLNTTVLQDTITSILDLFGGRHDNKH